MNRIDSHWTMLVCALAAGLSSTAHAQADVAKALQDTLPKGWECMQGPNDLDHPARAFYLDRRGVRYELADLSTTIRAETGELSSVVVSTTGDISAGLFAKRGTIQQGRERGGRCQASGCGQRRAGASEHDHLCAGGWQLHHRSDLPQADDRVFSGAAIYAEERHRRRWRHRQGCPTAE